MKNYKIKTEKDVIKLQDKYPVDDEFIVLETGENVCLSDLRMFADWNDFEKITIEHI